MPSPHALFPFIEGTIGSIPSTQIQSQALADWYRYVRQVMLSPHLRNQVDWEFIYTAGTLPAGVLAAGANLGANIVYGVLIGQSSADVERDHVCWGEGAAAVAYSGVAVPANTVMLIIQPPAAATAGMREWTGYVFPNGIAMAAGPEVASDGRDGTDTVAGDINVYTLLRDL